jgi:GxxExxY protein
MEMLEKKDLLYPDLSYQIIGCAYDVFNSISGGHKEVVYQNALSIALEEKGLAFTKEQYYPVKYNDIVVGKNFFDFYVEEKIVVELKSASRFSKANYDQVLNYLNVSKVNLALLISFGNEEVRCKRVVNFKELNTELKNTDS